METDFPEFMATPVKMYTGFGEEFVVSGLSTCQGPEEAIDGSFGAES